MANMSGLNISSNPRLITPLGLDSSQKGFKPQAGTKQVYEIFNPGLWTIDEGRFIVLAPVSCHLAPTSTVAKSGARGLASRWPQKTLLTLGSCNFVMSAGRCQRCRKTRPNYTKNAQGRMHSGSGLIYFFFHVTDEGNVTHTIHATKGQKKFVTNRFGTSRALCSRLSCEGVFRSSTMSSGNTLFRLLEMNKNANIGKRKPRMTPRKVNKCRNVKARNTGDNR